METVKNLNAFNEQNVAIAKSKSNDLLYQKFIEAAFALDASIVEPYISEDMKLQDLDKYRFLSDLQQHFDYIMHHHPEDFRVELANFTCAGCQKGKPLAGFEVFAGVSFAPYYKFGYVVCADENGKTTDLFVCRSFKPS